MREIRLYRQGVCKWNAVSLCLSPFTIVKRIIAFLSKYQSPSISHDVIIFLGWQASLWMKTMRAHVQRPSKRNRGRVLTSVKAGLRNTPPRKKTCTIGAPPSSHQWGPCFLWRYRMSNATRLGLSPWVNKLWQYKNDIPLNVLRQGAGSCTAGS